MVLGASPRRFCFGPRLNVFFCLLRVSDLVPSYVVAGFVVATIQSERGKTKSGDNKAGHRGNNGSRRLNEQETR